MWVDGDSIYKASPSPHPSLSPTHFYYFTFCSPVPPPPPVPSTNLPPSLFLLSGDASLSRLVVSTVGFYHQFGINHNFQVSGSQALSFTLLSEAQFPGVPIKWNYWNPLSQTFERTRLGYIFR